MASPLGKTLLIANPAAQSGQGKHKAELAAGILISKTGDNALDFAMTEGPEHAERIAQNMEGYQTILALGGDGVIHEVVNGLMKREANDRPTFGIIPSGSGNDYAKALGIENDVARACEQLLELNPKPTDVGKVNDRYFTETLSFGLDAAIALGTMEKRILTGQHGLKLYASSAVDQLMHSYRFYDYEMRVDDGHHITGRSITFAIQNGAYYGGGFKICPDAKVDDGKLDLCISHPPANKLTAVRLFIEAKSGKHTKAKQMEMLEAKKIWVRFHDEPPCQMDGERLEGKEFNVGVMHDALNVLRP